MSMNSVADDRPTDPHRRGAGTGLRAVMAAVAAGLARRLVGDLAGVGNALERLGRGEYWTEVPVQGSPGLQRVAAGVNALARQLRESTSRVEARELALVNTLGQVAEGRTPESANHMSRVGAMSCELARLAGLPAAEAELLRQAAPLHDIGKVGMPEAIVAKTTAYTPREREAMKAHAELGHRILAGSPRPELRAAAEIALAHHERWDGLGYPNGLEGEAIPLHGRIVGLVDAFDAMFSERAYRQAMTRDHGLGIISSQRGHHFDPRLADLLLENLPVFFGIMERHADTQPVRKSGGRPNRRPSTMRV